MGEAKEARSIGMENLLLQTEKYPTDLLQKFLCYNSNQAQFAAFNNDEEGSEEIELNLGLSLGGRFGVDKNSKKLIRSSSTVETIPLLREDEASTLPMASFPALVRASSLPTETEEEWRKRKKLQSLRRMEAKKRLFEKQKNKDGIGNGGCLEEEERREIEGSFGNLREKRPCLAATAASVRLNSNLTVAPPFGLPTWAAAARQALIGGIVDDVAKGKGCTSGGGGGGLPGGGQPVSQCSAESQGGSSSGTSELDSKHIRGSSSCGEARSSSQERGNVEAVGSSGTKMCENPSGSSQVEAKNSSKKPNSAEDNRGRREIGGRTTMEDMPCVFTIGDGPNGKRVEGILYKYGKGEEVRIMCVCHGKFLSPGEFVKHAGGKDVAHPLRHIVVNPNSAPFL